MTTCGIDWSQSITWLLVFSGWIAVHFFALHRERRKERRDAATQTVQELLAIESDALAFHQAESFNSEAAEKLIWRVNRLVRTLQRHPLSLLKIPKAEMTRLRRSITLKNADASSFSPQVSGGDVLSGIRYAADSLIEQLETMRDREFT